MNSDLRTVVVTVRFFDDAAITYLKKHGCKVLVADLPPGKPDTTLPKDYLWGLLENADAWILGSVPVTRDLLQKFGRLRIIARRGVGFDEIDLAAARDLGRIVTVGRGGNEESVADYTIALMLAVGRRILEYGARMRAGNWSVLKGTELNRKTVGLVGLGHIGRAVARRLKGFEATILAYDVAPDYSYAKTHGVTLIGLAELLGESDYVSLHAPLTTSSRNMIDAATLRLMKPTAVLVNTARAELVDEAALLECLNDGRIAGAGLDVFLGEHDPTQRSTAEALRALSNVVLTPHAAGSTVEGLARGNLSAAKSVIAILDGKTVPNDCVLVDGRNTREVKPFPSVQDGVS
jgi:D-3-phosphoglycerate dehydrogenase